MTQPSANFLSPSADSLETKYREPFLHWQQDPSPKNTSGMLKLLKPEIARGISIHVGRGNPLLVSQARRLTVKAMQSYDPSKARLGTHIINTLEGLKRINRQQTQLLKVPELISIEQNRVRSAEQELLDQLGRDPSLDELADHTGLSPRRLQHLRKFRAPVAEGSLQRADDEGAQSDSQPAVTLPGSNRPDDDPWLKLVYADLGPIDQKIMEWTLGLNGQPARSNQEIAFKLRLTPGAISQRKARIQALIESGRQLSPFGG